MRRTVRHGNRSQISGGPPDPAQLLLEVANAGTVKHRRLRPAYCGRSLPAEGRPLACCSGNSDPRAGSDPKFILFPGPQQKPDAHPNDQDDPYDDQAKTQVTHPLPPAHRESIHRWCLSIVGDPTLLASIGLQKGRSIHCSVPVSSWPSEFATPLLRPVYTRKGYNLVYSL
jgi:hypothetical protein